MASDEELYELYLTACEQGAAEEPGRFLARHPEASPALRPRLEALYRFTTHSGTGLAADEGLPFDRLGGYVLLRRLDRGGMGEVYVAESEDTGKTVALKVLRPELRGAATAIERFRREGEALKHLDHENIVRVIDAGEADDVLYLVMELFSGRTLDRVMDDGPPPTSTVVRWMRGIARALDHAHERGVVHRDVKPSNILIDDDGEPHLLDFGIARDEAWQGQTVTRTFAGSPLYAAPEQLRGDKVDGRADIYALGVTFYQAVTGAIPFEDVSGDRIYIHILRHDPPPPRELNPSLPRPLELVVMKALSKRPADRYATGAAFARDLQALLDLRPVAARPPNVLVRLRKWSRRRPGRAAAAAGAALVLLLALGFVGYEQWAAGRRTRAEARQAVDDARALLQQFGDERRAVATLEKKVKRARELMWLRYTTQAEERFLDRREREIDRSRVERESAFHEVLRLLQRAERLGASTRELDGIRLDLYLERLEEARLMDNHDAMNFYRGMAEQLVPERVRQASSAVFSMRGDPPDAEIFLFRLREQAELIEDGDVRMVPVPWRGETPVPPGTWVLRVVEGAGDLVPDDLILKIAGAPIRHTLFASNGDRLLSVDGQPVRDVWDIEELKAPKVFEFASGRTDPVEVVDARTLAEIGDVRATVYRRGESVAMELPVGLRVRTTARPLFFSDAARIEPGQRLEVDEGEYVAVLRRDGFEPARVSFPLAPGEDKKFTIALSPRMETPGGYVHVWSGHRVPAFWIMEREVTVAEYFEFLNDPEVTAPERHVPRHGVERFAEVTASGFVPTWREDRPILAVSWHDARAYAAWRTRRARKQGKPWRFELATHCQWARALGGVMWMYPFGKRFRPKWVKSCFARRRAGPEPGMRFPIDESVHGVYDMCGSASEWLLDWYDETRGHRQLVGGNWGLAKPDDFTPYRAGARADNANAQNGFRLVLNLERS